MADNGRKYREKYGEWALVTGASAGIGLEFARALAREGMSIVLTARREDRLNALAAELKEKHHVDTRVVAVDLAADDGAIAWPTQSRICRSHFSSTTPASVTPAASTSSRPTGCARWWSSIAWCPSC